MKITQKQLQNNLDYLLTYNDSENRCLQRPLTADEKGNIFPKPIIEIVKSTILNCLDPKYQATKDKEANKL